MTKKKNKVETVVPQETTPISVEEQTTVAKGEMTEQEKSLFDSIKNQSDYKFEPHRVPRGVHAVDMGRIRNAKDVAYADAILKAKRKDPWEAIQLILDAWASKNPNDFNGFVKHIHYTKQDLKDKKFGTTGDKDMERRLTIMMPEHVHHMIRAIFKPEELIMDKEFFHEFARRFPMFQVPEKI